MLVGEIVVRILSLILFAFGFSLVACSRQAQFTQSQISITAPNILKAKLASDPMPTDRVACYGVNIKGAGSAAAANSCSPETAMLVGFVASGQNLTASVSKGSTLGIELYLYLEPPGVNIPCPHLQAAFGADQLLNSYLVGTASGVAVTQDQVEVDIEANFPGVAQNVAAQMSLPSSCTASPALPSGPNSNHFQISAASQTVVEQGQTLSTGVRLIGRVGSVPKQVLVAPGGAKLLIK